MKMSCGHYRYEKIHPEPLKTAGDLNGRDPSVPGTWKAASPLPPSRDVSSLNSVKGQQFL